MVLSMWLEGVLTREQISFREDIREFVRNNLAPIAQGMYAANSDGPYHMDDGLLEKIGRHRLHGVGIPTDFGGIGLGAVERVILNEEFGYEDLSAALMFVTTGMFANAILHHGTQEQKQRYLREIADGAVCSFFLSEPSSGSDAFGSMQTRLKIENKIAYISGSKTWGTNGAIAKYALVFVKLEDGIKAVIVPNAALNDGQGYRDYSLIRKMGLASSSTILVHFDMLQIPEEAIIQAEGTIVAKDLLNLSRLEIAAEAVGAARRYVSEVQTAVKANEKYIDEATRRVLRHKVAEYIEKVNVARLMLYRSAAELAKGKLEPYKASVSKLYCSGILVDATQELSSLFHCKVPFGSPVDRIQRDAAVYKIFEGTSEMQQNTIAETKLKLPKV